MALAPGMRLGPYEIVVAIGAGGMGEVYRARDTRLGRDVAVKVLPPAFAADPERLRRFEQEARAVAALNHPNILALYDVGQHEGAPYVVSELLEGDTLRVLLPLPQRKAIEYGVEIAEGLAAAHQKGITHRDLKPENLFVTHDGRVKILDFGLAKLTATAEGAETAATAGLETQPGAVLGTVGYMSPEQARGQPADHRSDIFSFGAVFYEMLSHQRAFHRESAADTLSAILRDEPPEISVPPGLDRLLRRCLEKNPEQRFQSAQDLAFALEAVSGVTTAAQPAPAAAPAPPRISAKAVAAIAAVLLLAAALAVWRFWPAGAAPEWTGVRLGGPDVAYWPRISPDGHTLAFQAMVDGQTQLGVMNVDSGAWNVLTSDRTRGQLFSISWSPDGAKIYFDRFDSVPRGVFSIPPVGGEERLVLEDAMIPEALTDGSLLVTRVNGQRDYQLHRYRPATGRVDPLPAVVAQMGPGPAPLVRVFPDGREVAFFGGPLNAGSGGKAQFYALDMASGRLRPLRTQSAITEFGTGLATDPQGRYFATITKSGDLSRVVAIPRDGSGAERTLLVLTNTALNMDLARDGSLYLDQSDHPIDVLRFAVSGGTPERLAGALNAGALPYPYALRLADGRTLHTSVIAGRLRVLIARPGRNPVPLVETEETSGPMALLSNEEVALVAGSGSDQVLAVISLRDGRIVRRLEGTRGLNLVYFRLAASADSKTLYYTDSGQLWSIPASGGQPQKIRPADSVALDPSTGNLVLQLNETAGTRFLRFSPATGEQAPILFNSPLRPAPAVLSSNAVGKDGRIVISISSPDSYFLLAAVLDPRTGKVDRVPLNFTGDIFVPGWAPDGTIVTEGWRMQSALWRFRR